MGQERLTIEVRRILGQSRRLVIWCKKAEQLDLLPALVALKELSTCPGRREVDPEKPGWQEVCRSLGISAEMVRQWRLRTQSEHDIRTLLGETENVPRKKTLEVPLDVPKFKKAVGRLVQFVLDAEFDEADRAAMDLAELYQL